MTKRYKSEALVATHKTALESTGGGVMSKGTMRASDEMCLTPVGEMPPLDIRELRLHTPLVLPATRV